MLQPLIDVIGALFHLVQILRQFLKILLISVLETGHAIKKVGYGIHHFLATDISTIWLKHHIMSGIQSGLHR